MSPMYMHISITEYALKQVNLDLCICEAVNIASGNAPCMCFSFIYHECYSQLQLIQVDVSKVYANF
jgi:hypothetical protein